MCELKQQVVIIFDAYGEIPFSLVKLHLLRSFPILNLEKSKKCYFLVPLHQCFVIK